MLCLRLLHLQKGFSPLSHLSPHSPPPFPTLPPAIFTPRWVYKPKCLTLALSCAHPSDIYTNPSLASRSHFLLSPHFVVLLVASFVCFSCCYKKLIRIVNFVFIRQANWQQTAETLKHSDSRFKIKIFITTRRHLSVPFRSVQNSACLASPQECCTPVCWAIYFPRRAWEMFCALPCRGLS